MARLSTIFGVLILAAACFLTSPGTATADHHRGTEHAARTAAADRQPRRKDFT